MANGPNPAEVLTQLIFGKWASMALAVVAKLHIADQLAEGPKSADELARMTGTHSEALYRVMRALTGLGIFATDKDGCFHLTEVGQLLRTGVPGSLRGIADYCGSEWSWRAWQHLGHSVRTGRTAFNDVFGEPLFDYLSKQPEESAVFNEAMTGFSGVTSAAVAAAFDFAPFHTLVDIGGGHGLLLATVLKRYPKLKGILFDAPHVVNGGPELLREHGVDDRCECHGGDFFSEVPAGGDVYIMKHIIHDWNDEDAGRILTNVRRAVTPGTRLLIVELVIPAGDQPHPGKLLDLEMLVVASGKERTESEYDALLATAGFEFNAVVPTQSPASVVVATAV